MEVEYLKPVPLGKPLIVEGWEVRVRGRRHTNAAEIRNETGDVLARSKGLFIAIDPHAMFAKHINGNTRRDFFEKNAKLKMQNAK
jgi:acyl-CoA thioesterase FadM